MRDASWEVMRPDDRAWVLPADLRAGDRLQARDCGWVGQMRPFIRHFSRKGDRVVDPFCGFGTSLLAAALEGRRGVGIDIDAGRVRIAGERLRRHGMQAELYVGDAAGLAVTDIDLCVTNIPYFGCRGLASDDDGQLYAAGDYMQYLAGLRRTFHALRTCLRRDAFLVVMAENIVVGGRRIPQAWDVARILDSLYLAHEERVLCYAAPAADRGHACSATNRSHEYALVYQHRRPAIDLAATQALLQAMADAGMQFDVFGSFQQWQAQGACADGHVPSDADLALPPDLAQLERMLTFLDARGFALSLWGEPVVPPVSVETVRRHHYLRAERVGRDGGLVRIDLSIAAPDAAP